MQGSVESGVRTNMAPGQLGFSTEAGREVKRKSSAQGGVNGPLLKNAIQHIIKEPSHQAHSSSVFSP